MTNAPKHLPREGGVLLDALVTWLIPAISLLSSIPEYAGESEFMTSQLRLRGPGDLTCRAFGISYVEVINKGTCSIAPLYEI